MSPDTAEITRPSPPPSEALKRTPLHALHLRHGAKMVPFAGYNMPVQYPAGLLKEHLHTRTQAGLFDVSHMGQLSVRSDSGDLAGAARALEALIPIDILGLAPGRQRYGFLTNEAGGILDDLMVANLGDRFLIVVNAANKEQDAAHLRAHLPEGIDLEAIPDALIALQGPQAHVTLARLTADIDGIRFMDARATTILGAPCLVARSGYTGEDGFEISIPADRAEEIAEALLADADVLPVGLGARDSLRLEAGLCLHGADIDVGTTPVEAGLLWAIQPVRRPGGARAGGF
ncbi:glycine cleavage system aminomethyltransferase GcvT, partial [Methylobacterium haplocladii]